MPRFDRDWKKLSEAERDAFGAAVKQFVAALKEGKGQFPPALRVHRIDGAKGVWSLTWGDDARATFHFGEPLSPGDPHVVWRRVGTHAIYKSA